MELSRMEKVKKMRECNVACCVDCEEPVITLWDQPVGYCWK